MSTTSPADHLQLFQPLRPLNVSLRATSCDICRLQKKRCTKEKDGCQRCEAKGLKCEYSQLPIVNGILMSGPASAATDQSDLSIPVADRTSPIPNCDTTPNGSLATSLQTLLPLPEPSIYQPKSSAYNSNYAMDQILCAIENPLMDVTYENEWSIQDPDLMPTTADWALCHRFFMTDKRAGGILLSLDGRGFLDTFFHQPAPLRLVLCAAAAHFSLETSEQVTLSYYNRARKAMMRVADTPSFKTAQAFIWINFFSRWMGQPAIGQPFFKVALDMCSALMLHIDPDDSPWLHHLQLTEIEKEERRRFFWNCVFTLRTEQSFSADAIQLDLPTGGVRPMRAVTEPYSALPSMDSHGPLCNVYGVIVAIKRHHTVVPTSVEEIIASESVLALGNYLLKVHSSMEDRFLLIAESPQFVSWSDEVRFLSQLSNLSVHETPYVVFLNLNLLASMSLLMRPRLYLSSLATHQPHLLCPETLDIITTAIEQSVESVLRISALLSFLVKIAETEKRFSIQAHTQPLYPAFESAIVIWFLICRMDPEWRSTVPSLLNQNWKDFRDRLLFLLEFVKGLLLGQHHESGMLMPIITCMQAMMTEVVETLLTGASPGSAEPVEEIIVGMKVCSIGAEEHDEPSITREPWAFLGLLGMEVGPGLRWSGRSEDEWRRFWKKY